MEAEIERFLRSGDYDPLSWIGVRTVTDVAYPMALKRGIDDAVETVVKLLKKFSKPIKDKKDISQIAKWASRWASRAR